MPNATFKMNGTTAMSKSGTDISIASGVVFPAGHIIQVRTPVAGSGTDTDTAEDYDDSNVSDTIAFEAGNKILIFASVQMHCHSGGSEVGSQACVHNGTSIVTNEPQVFAWGSDHGDQDKGTAVCMGLDSPSGTSATYTVQWRAQSGGTAVIDQAQTRLQLMEVQA